MNKNNSESIRFLTPEELQHSRAFFELTLPQPFTWFLYGVLLLLLTGILYIWIGELEVIVRGQVILQTKQNISELKSSLTGMVSEKYYVTGQKIKAGDNLWSLDTHTLEAQRLGTIQKKSRIESQLMDVRYIIEVLDGLAESVPKERMEALRQIQLIQREDRNLSLIVEQDQRNYELERALPRSSQTPAKLKDLETAYLLSKGQLESFRLEQKQTFSEKENILKSQLEELTSQLAFLDQQLRGAKVQSGIDGWVEEVKKINVGDVILAGDIIVRVVPLSAGDLKAVINVSSNDIAEIKEGMQFRLIFPKLPPSEFGQLEGTIKTVPQDAWLQPDSPPVFQLEGSLTQLWMENNQGLRINLKAGMTAEARIIVKKKGIWRFILEKLDFVK